MTKDTIEDIQRDKIFLNGHLANQDLCNIDLSKVRALNSSLTSVSLSFASLSGIDWKNTDLKDCSLSSVNAKNAKIRMCTFTQVFAQEADFSDATIENCKAQGCNFDNADFTDASLTDNDFNRSSFVGANFTNTDASYCNMRGGDFCGAKLIKTNFREADLRGADFTGAHIDSADFRGANIEGALFDDNVSQSDGQQPSADINELLGVVNPVVSSILKVGGAQKLSSNEEATEELARIMKAFGSPNKAVDNDPETDRRIQNVINQATDFGIAPLLEALQQEGGEPPLAVKKLIEGMMRDYGLDGDSTTEDLLASLMSTVKEK